MNNDQHPVSPHAEELLVDQATGDLDELHQAELEALLNEETVALQEELMQTAALVQVGMLTIERRGAEKMPEHLRQSIQSQAALKPVTETASNVVQLAAPAAKAKASSAPSASTNLFKFGGWAAAAALALALVVPQKESSLSPVAERQEMLAHTEDVIVAPWAQPEQAGYEQVRGDVTWSDNEQRGFMRLAGLPANEPTKAQ